MSITDLCNVVPAWNMTNDEWLQARQSGIGGSEIGAIAGLSKYESLYSIWARKVHDVSSFEGNAATDLGNLLELPVAQAFAKETNNAVVEWKVILRSKTHTFLSANVDFFIVEASDQFPAGVVTEWQSVEEPDGIISILECKTGALASPGSPHEWFKDGGSIPDGYACQGLWYLTATGLEKVEFACLLGGYGMQYRTLLRDDSTIRHLLEIGESFWETYVRTSTPPPLDGSDATESAIKSMYPRSAPGKAVEGGDDLAALWSEFQAAKAESKTADERQKSLRAQILAIIGDAEVALVNGDPIATWKTGKDTEFFATEVFKNDHPDMFKQYTRSRHGFRTLREKK